ncbi:lytic transglycosylase domain-containing protein [Flavimaricola marinus]|uniref:Soluble lytic murein transglycosylase n=1 Tax=Flavimaricola marinus TaxID=1819565 RepID=A0A238LFL9_9RHOB|nr:lytic transglycosylase domain-containing protein [Flavimaricola marinus]SMY08382.1 Soluble lytic murein transglycosylase precursor [Flavimaricola marinus]
MRTLLLCLALAMPLGQPATGQTAPVSGFVAAAEAIEAEDWDLAYLLAESDGVVARDLVTWARLRAGAGTFDDYLRFLGARPDWPGLDTLRSRAELAIPDGADPVSVVAFFGEELPQTGQGAVRMAAALDALGLTDQARDMLIDTWLTQGLTDAGQEAMLSAHREFLAPHHADRTDAMLWRWRTTDAARMLDLISDDQRALAEARIALIRNSANRNALVGAVPELLRDTAGLAYDRFNRLADSGDYTDASALLMERSDSAASLGQPFRWASWRATLARWQMREGRPDMAYAMASQHRMTGDDIRSATYSDLEWLAGYISLTYLDDPAQALRHFQAVEAVVDTPISIGRAGYWLGRAHVALGDAAAAAEAYGRAAEHQTSFYGLLAAERLGRPLDPALTGAEEFPTWRGAEALSSDLTRAMLLLMQADRRGEAILFVTAQGRSFDRVGLAQLGAMLTEMDEPFFTLVVGKNAAARGIVLPAIYFPVHPLAEMDLPVEPALALSIARRESEFNFVVGSPVGALGLMQLMPGTAEEVAGELDLPYSRARLTSDWVYNATLGARYLANLEEQFGKSPVMIAAGYNAGPSRPSTWMTQRGDPRKGEVDVIDWIEHIPFTETRNYVMRVTESIPVYRARLSGETGPLLFTQLLNGAVPFIRPVARPTGTDSQSDSQSDSDTSSGETAPAPAPATAADAAPAASIAAPAAPAAPQGPATIRPIARPGG